MSDPIATENAINDLTAKYAELKRLAAAIIVRRDEAATAAKTARDELDALTTQLEAALDEDRDEQAIALLEAHNTAEATVAARVADLERAETDIVQAKEGLVEIRTGIEDLRVARHRAVVSDARATLAASLDPSSVDAEMMALDNARAHIKQTLAQVGLERELNESDLDRRLRDLRREDPEASARAQLEELKKTRAGVGKNPSGPVKKM